MRVDLPEPTPPEREHSAHVAQRIRDEIENTDGAIDFARYMELALYAPGLGYYSAGAQKFGASGDFVTAPELGSVFARCLARALAPQVRGRDLLELGPGSGSLASELLLELEQLDALPARYRLLERSADLRVRQRETLSARCAHLLDRCDWLDAPPLESWRGVLLANEVVDALPVRTFVARENGLFVRNVACGANGDFVWRESPVDETLHRAISQAVDNIGALPRPYFSEVCTMLDAWLAEVTHTLIEGNAWFIDYGYANGEYYAPSRRTGTLRCFYRHRMHDDPLILPGLQDITASVDFDALARAGERVGLAVEAHATQSQFLIANGLDEVFARAYAQARDEAARYTLAQKIKRLTLPEQMGEKFRVMELRKS